jgi:hypothetical protein
MDVSCLHLQEDFWARHQLYRQRYANQQFDLLIAARRFPYIPVLEIGSKASLFTWRLTCNSPRATRLSSIHLRARATSSAYWKRGYA